MNLRIVSRPNVGIIWKLRYLMVRRALIKLNVLALTDGQTQQWLQDHRNIVAGGDVSGSP